MELKKEFIKTTISFMNNYSKCFFISTEDKIDTISLLIKIFTKYNASQTNITIISDSRENLNPIFPNLDNGIKLGTYYSIKQNRFIFNILNIELLKDTDDTNEIIIIYPFESFKPKTLSKYINKCSKLKKLILIGKNLDKSNLPDEIEGLNVTEFSFIPTHSSLYYSYMTSRLSDMN